jgi:putative PIN family toxin of toxin-antitoxin system
MRLVIDSNVIIAAFAVRGLCHALFEYCLQSHDVILCESIIKEVTKHLRGRIKVPASVVTEIEVYLRESAIIDKPATVDPNAFGDKSDLPILGVALASGSSYIITGDKALLALNKYKDIDIISPRSFWEKMKKETNH